MGWRKRRNEAYRRLCPPGQGSADGLLKAAPGLERPGAADRAGPRKPGVVSGGDPAVEQPGAGLGEAGGTPV